MAIWEVAAAPILNFKLSPSQWRAEGGAKGATAPDIQGKGASKEWKYKNLNADN